MTNPYQDVIDWLRSPEGERWSEERLMKGFHRAYRELGTGNGGPGLMSVVLPPWGPVSLPGVFTIK